MKKKLFYAVSVFFIAAIAFMSTNSIRQNSETTLSSLFKINTASAECCDTPINNGRCSSLSGNCYPDPGGVNNCDSTKGGC